MFKKSSVKSKTHQKSFKLTDMIKLIALLIPVVQLLRQMKNNRK